MSRLLFIGSTVADVILRVPRLPSTGDDLLLQGQTAALGGCAFNACCAARLMGADCTLFSPVGTGVWGDWVRRAMSSRGVTTAAPMAAVPNGCCYCLVDPDGERTFLCDHGAEYQYRPEWFDRLDAGSFDGVCVNGLELEERSGDVILDWLERYPPRRLYFDPGPRVCHIPPRRMARLFALHPALHLNESEAQQFTDTRDNTDAARAIAGLTGWDVVITMGADGALVLRQGKVTVVPAVKAEVRDTIGAGDAHLGAIMALEGDGLPLEEAVREANRLSAAVIGQTGGTLSPMDWNRWKHQHGGE